GHRVRHLRRTEVGRHSGHSRMVVVAGREVLVEGVDVAGVPGPLDLPDRRLVGRRRRLGGSPPQSGCPLTGALLGGCPLAGALLGGCPLAGALLGGGSPGGALLGGGSPGGALLGGGSPGGALLGGGSPGGALLGGGSPGGALLG